MLNLTFKGGGGLGRLVSVIAPKVTPATNIITEIIIPIINEVFIYYKKKNNKIYIFITMWCEKHRLMPITTYKSLTRLSNINNFASEILQQVRAIIIHYFKHFEFTHALFFKNVCSNI